MSANRIVIRNLSAAVLAALPLLATAQSAGTAAPQRVEIRTPQLADAPRRDVTTVCPKIQDELPEALASAWQAVGKPGVVRVQFTLDGQRVTDVTPVSGPARYARWVRSALQDVSCRSDRQQAQVFQLDIRFVDIYDRPEQRAVALLLP
jgi:hypothetical protein